MASANYLEERMTILQIGIKEKYVSLKKSNGASFHNFRSNTAEIMEMTHRRISNAHSLIRTFKFKKGLFSPIIEYTGHSSKISDII